MHQPSCLHPRRYPPVLNDSNLGGDDLRLTNLLPDVEEAKEDAHLGPSFP